MKLRLGCILVPFPWLHQNTFILSFFPLFWNSVISNQFSSNIHYFFCFPSSIFQTVKSILSIIINKYPLYVMKNHLQWIWNNNPLYKFLQRISSAYYLVQVYFFFFFLPVHKWLHMIYNQWLHHKIHSYITMKNYYHIWMHVVYIIWKHRNRPYRFIHKHHHKLLGESL